MLPATLLSMLIYTTLYTISVIKFMTCDHNYSLWTWIWLMRHSGQRQDVAFWFQCWKNSSCFIWPVYKVVIFIYLDHWIASWQMFIWTGWTDTPYSWGRSSYYSNRLHDFVVTNLLCYKDLYINSFFIHTARLWNSLPGGCFPLTCNLNVLSLKLINTCYHRVLSNQFSCMLFINVLFFL